MNWVGGIRNKLRHQDQRKQQKGGCSSESNHFPQDHFEHKRQSGKFQLQPLTTPADGGISQDLISLQTIRKVHGENKQVRTAPVVSVVLGKARPPTNCGQLVNHIQLPAGSPCGYPAGLLSMDLAQQKKGKSKKGRLRDRYSNIWLPLPSSSSQHSSRPGGNPSSQSQTQTTSSHSFVTPANQLLRSDLTDGYVRTECSRSRKTQLHLGQENTEKIPEKKKRHIPFSQHIYDLEPETPFIPYSRPATKIAIHNASYSSINSSPTENAYDSEGNYLPKQVYDKEGHDFYNIYSMKPPTRKSDQNSLQTKNLHGLKTVSHDQRKRTHEEEEFTSKRQALFVSEDFQVTPLRKYSHDVAHKHRKRSHLSSYYPGEQRKAIYDHLMTDSKRQKAHEHESLHQQQTEDSNWEDLLDDSVFNRIECCDNKEVSPPQMPQQSASHLITLSPKKAGTHRGVSRITDNVCMLQPKVGDTAPASMLNSSLNKISSQPIATPYDKSVKERLTSDDGAPKYKQNLATLLLETPAHQSQGIIATPLPTPKPTPKTTMDDVSSPKTINISHVCEDQKTRIPHQSQSTFHSHMAETQESGHQIEMAHDFRFIHGTSKSQTLQTIDSENSLDMILPSVCTSIRAEQYSLEYSEGSWLSQQEHNGVSAPSAPSVKGLSTEPKQYQGSQCGDKKVAVEGLIMNNSNNGTECPKNTINTLGHPFTETPSNGYIDTKESVLDIVVRSLLKDIVSCVVMLESSNLFVHLIPNSAGRWMPKQNAEVVIETPTLKEVENVSRDSAVLTTDKPKINVTNTGYDLHVHDALSRDRGSCNASSVECCSRVHCLVNKNRKIDSNSCKNITDSVPFCCPIIQQVDAASECLVLKQPTVSQFVLARVQEKQISTQTDLRDYTSTATECLLITNPKRPSLVDSSTSPIVSINKGIVDCANSPVIVPSSLKTICPGANTVIETEVTYLLSSSDSQENDRIDSLDAPSIEKLSIGIPRTNTSKITDQKSKYFHPNTLKVLAQSVLDMIQTKLCDAEVLESGESVTEEHIYSDYSNLQSRPSVYSLDDSVSVCVERSPLVIHADSDKDMSSVKINYDILEGKLIDVFHSGQAAMMCSGLKSEDIIVEDSQQPFHKTMIQQSKQCSGDRESEIVAYDHSDHSYIMNYPSDIEQVVPSFETKISLELKQVHDNGSFNTKQMMATLEQTSDSMLPHEQCETPQSITQNLPTAGAKIYMDDCGSLISKEVGTAPENNTSELVCPESQSDFSIPITLGLIGETACGGNITDCNMTRELGCNKEPLVLDCCSESSEYDTADSQTDS